MIYPKDQRMKIIHHSPRRCANQINISGREGFHKSLSYRRKHVWDNLIFGGILSEGPGRFNLHVSLNFASRNPDSLVEGIVTFHMAISIPILEERKHVIPWNLLETLLCKVNITMENGQISLKISIFFTYTWGTFSIAMFFFYRSVTWRIRPINFVPLDWEIGRPDSSCF